MNSCNKTTRLAAPHTGVDYLGERKRVYSTYSEALKDADYANSTEDWYGNKFSKLLYFFCVFATTIVCATIFTLIFI